MTSDETVDADVIGILRADGNTNTGAGHVMRMLALGELLSNIGKFVFVTNQDTQTALIDLFAASGLECCLLGNFRDSREVRFLRQRYPNARLVVTDGYHFSEEYHRALSVCGFKVIRILDHAGRYFFADLIINHSPGVQREHYPDNQAIPLCLGLNFALLRKPFLSRAKLGIASKVEGKNLFINMGSGDPFDVTENILSQMEKIDWAGEIHIVVGGLNSTNIVSEYRSQCSSQKTYIHQNISANEIIKLLEKTRVAICSASTISLEVCACRVPLIVGWVVDNQKLIYDGLVNKGMALGVGDLKSVNDANLESAFLELSEPDNPKLNEMLFLQEKYLPGSSSKNLEFALRGLLKHF